MWSATGFALLASSSGNWQAQNCAGFPLKDCVSEGSMDLFACDEGSCRCVARASVVVPRPSRVAWACNKQMARLDGRWDGKSQNWRARKPAFGPKPGERIDDNGPAPGLQVPRYPPTYRLYRYCVRNTIVHYLQQVPNPSFHYYRSTYPECSHYLGNKTQA